MAIKQITKHQHYVPNFLLKQFADRSQMVQVYESATDVLETRRTRRVLVNEFFYDDDNAIEDFLGDRIEDPAAPILKGIVASPSMPISQSAEAALLTFMAVQMARTPRALNQMLEFTGKFTDGMLQKLGELNGLPAEAMSGIKVKVKDERVLLGLAVAQAAIGRWLIEDLSWHVLSNATTVPFIISDHPAVHYNWFLRHSKHPGAAGVSVHGVQVFLPLSPLVTLALIDKAIYRFGDKGSSYTALTSVADVELLNSLQLRARQKFAVFPVGVSDTYVKQRCMQFPADSLFTSRASASAPIDIGNDQFKTQHVTWREQVLLPAWLSISRIKRRAARKDPVCDDRRPEAVAAHAHVLETLRAMPLQQGA